MDMLRTIHSVWLGPRMPPLAHACIDDWKKQGYTVRLWTEKDELVRKLIAGNSFSRECYSRKLYAFVSDYLRLEILRQYGGIYLDLDVTIRKDPFPLCDGNKFVAGYESSTKVGTAVIYSEPDSTVLKRASSFYEDDIWRSELFIGPDILTKVIDGLSFNNEVECVLLPENTFFPYKGEPLDFDCPDEAVLIHWFEHSWKGSKGMFFLKTKSYNFWRKAYEFQKHLFNGRFFRGL